MSKIEEIAWGYVDEKRDLTVGTVNIQFDCFDMVDAVKYGGNAVLSEIKQYIQQATKEHEVGLIWLSGLINVINKLEGKG